jgi:hypothetical protein
MALAFSDIDKVELADVQLAGRAERLDLGGGFRFFDFLTQQLGLPAGPAKNPPMRLMTRE